VNPDPHPADAPGTVLAVVDALCDLYPYVARQMGRHDYDGRLPSLTRRSGADLATLAAKVDRHLADAATGVDPELRADLDTSRTLLEYLRFRADEIGQHYPQPLEFVAETDVSGYLAADYAPVAERMDALVRHLAGIPAFLARGEELLGPSVALGERMNVIAWGREQAAALAGVHEPLVAGRPDLAARVASVAGPAAAACGSFAAAVAAKPPAAHLHGPEHLAEMLRVAEGVAQPVVADLIARAEQEVAAARAAIDRFPASAHEQMRRSEPPASVAGTVRSIADRLRDFWIDSKVMPVHTRLPLEIHQSPAEGVTFVISPPREAVRRPHRVYVPEPGRSAYLSPPTLEMLAVHEIYAGHYLHMEAASRGPSVIRNSVFWFAACTEGWAHYTEALAIEQGLADGRPLVEIAQQRFALEAATRLLVHLCVHSRRWTFAKACSRAAELTGWPADRATREVLETVTHRARAMYTLGKIEIQDWRSAVVGQGGLTSHDFHDRLMRCGSAPLSTIRRYLTDGRAPTNSR
jgi:hypothetical protein